MPTPDLVRIAGGGPAGLACAIRLAENGVRVEVHEALDDVGGRFDGDHQILTCFGETPPARELLASVRVDVDDLETRLLDGARLLGGAGRVELAASEDPFAWLIRRGPGPGTLDHALRRRAEVLGATVVPRSRLPLENAHVVATGASAVDGVAMERTFRTSSSRRVDVLFDNQLVPGGYAYLFIEAGEGTLGAAAVASYRDLEPMLDAARERFHDVEAFEVRDPRQRSHTMNFALPRSARQDGRLYVGEAAGFQDYLFGLGIAFALVSGRLAAESLLGGANYDSAWRAAIEPRMLTSVVDRYLYEKLPRSADPLLDRLSRGDLRVRLDGLQRSSWIKRTVLWYLRRRWWGGMATRCRHQLKDHHCRRTAHRANPTRPTPP